MMISKIYRPCWLKYCQPGISSLPAPGQLNQTRPLYGNSLRGSGYRVIANVVSTTPVGADCCSSNHGRHWWAKTCQIQSSHKQQCESFPNRIELRFSPTENLLLSARFQVGSLSLADLSGLAPPASGLRLRPSGPLLLVFGSPTP